MDSKVYSGWDELPKGYASDKITEGCIVLEGGAFRAVYTSGVLDVLMKENINMSCVCGVSAGAMNGANYAAGQIGRSGRINLRYRHDRNYVGVKPMITQHGVIGFDFVFGELDGVEPFDYEAFSGRRFVAVTTDVDTGRPHYWEKKNCKDLFQAIRASASMPYVSAPVEVEGTYNLDGGCSVNIPYRWAIEQGYKKIIVVKTRSDDYRDPLPTDRRLRLIERIYKDKPALAYDLCHTPERYNLEIDELHYLTAQHRLFTITPSRSLDDIGRLESDMEKLGALYYLGVKDAEERLEDLKGYLNYL
ncbi:MAG: patatin family protein [Clostridiales bacterium]|nr:patatin family protein [Clostridiales bacterium]